MKCPKCKADLTEDFMNVWKAGYLEGEGQLQKTINMVTEVNKNLLDELLRLDFDKPVDYDPKNVKITIKLTILKKFIKCLRTKKNNYHQRFHYSTILFEHLQLHEEQQRIIAENIEKGLKNESV